MSDLLGRLLGAEMGRVLRLEPRATPALAGVDGSLQPSGIVEEHVEREWVNGAPNGIAHTRRVDGLSGRAIDEATTPALQRKAHPSSVAHGATSSPERSSREAVGRRVPVAPPSATPSPGSRATVPDAEGALDAAAAPEPGRAVFDAPMAAAVEPMRGSVSASLHESPSTSLESSNPNTSSSSGSSLESSTSFESGSAPLRSALAASDVWAARAASTPWSKPSAGAPGSEVSGVPAPDIPDGPRAVEPAPVSIASTASPAADALRASNAWRSSPAAPTQPWASTAARPPAELLEVPRAQPALQPQAGTALAVTAGPAPAEAPPRDVAHALPVPTAATSAAPTFGFGVGAAGLADAIRAFAASASPSAASSPNEDRLGPSGAASPAPVVRVRIGRLEVHAPPAPVPAAPRVERARSGLSLQELLRQREGS